MKRNSKINVGIIGTGFGAKVHVPGFRALPGVSVLGITGKSQQKTSQIAKELGIPLSFRSWEKLIKHPEINAISIVSPPPFHKKMALYAAIQRKHVFCEKPLAMSVSEAKEMVSAVGRAKIVHGVDFEFRNIPGIQSLYKLIKKNTIGEIKFVTINWLTGSRALANMPISWQNIKKEGGGVLFSHGPHVIDYTEMLFGKIKSVYSNLTIAKKNKRATAEDLCSILCSFETGAFANISISNVLPGVHTHSIEVYGSSGFLKLVNEDQKNPDYGFRLFHSQSGKEIEISIPTPEKAKETQDTRTLLFENTAVEFIKAIRGENSNITSFLDGLRVQVVLEAIQKANKTKKTVTV